MSDGEAPVDFQALALIRGTEAHRLQQQDAGELPVAGEGLEARGQRGLHLSQRAVRARDPGGHRLREPGRELVDEGQEERLLVREVVVDGALGRAGGPHDVVDQSPVIPFLARRPPAPPGESCRGSPASSFTSSHRRRSHADSHRSQPGSRRRLHVLRAQRGEGEGPGHRGRARAGGHRIAQPARPHRRARGHRGVRRDLRAGARAVPDDGSRRLDGEGLRPDPGREGARSRATSSRRRWSPSRAATPPPPCCCASTWAIRPPSRSPSTRSPRSCWRARPIWASSSTRGRSPTRDGPPQGARPGGGVAEGVRPAAARSASTSCAGTWARQTHRRDLAGAPRLDRLRLRQRGRGARVRDALRAGDRQGDLPPLRPDVRQRLHQAAGRRRPGRPRRASTRWRTRRA